jgi:rod shape-determining protein MreC
MTVDTKTSDAFARILCEPTAGVSRHRQLLVLLGDPAAMPPMPPPENAAPDRPRRRKEGAD